MEERLNNIEKIRENFKTAKLCVDELVTNLYALAGECLANGDRYEFQEADYARLDGKNLMDEMRAIADHLKNIQKNMEKQ